MADVYSWSSSRDNGGSRLPGPDRLGWWATAAMLMSILLHVIVFFMLDQLKIAFKFEEAKELSTRPIDVRQVEVRPMEDQRALPPEEIIKPPADTNSLLEEIDILSVLPEDQEIDIKPEVVDAEYAVRIQNPAMEGAPEATAPEVATSFEIDADLPELGREPESIKPAAIGQLTVDPGAVEVDDSGLGKFAEDLMKHGANGKAANGTMDGIDSLDNLLDLPPNVLVGKKTMLPSDLLFEFNSSILRESAKVGLMKLGLLMDRNPNLYCWIEGHTDLVGGDEFNLNLSIQRAEAVKSYLVNSLKMDGAKIVTRGFGRYEPLITSGTAEEQSANRRVEIRMRKTLPTKEQMKIAPQKASVVEEAPAPAPAPTPAPQETPPPKAVLVKPNRVPTEEMLREAPKAQPAPAPQQAPKAEPVEESPAPPPMRALPAFPEVPKAEPVEEAPAPPRAVPRAQPVE